VGDPVHHVSGTRRRRKTVRGKLLDSHPSIFWQSNRSDGHAETFVAAKPPIIHPCRDFPGNLRFTRAARASPQSDLKINL
jgi:hypothetical protein